MEQSKETALARSQRFFELVSSLVSGKNVVTLDIGRHELPLYSSAALATGYRVREIAKEGEKYPTYRGGVKLSNKDGGKLEPIETYIRVGGKKDRIAISVEGPGRRRFYDEPFWAELNKLYKEQAPSFFKPTKPTI